MVEEEVISKKHLKNIELFIKPIDEALNERIPATLPGGKVYLTRIDSFIEHTEVIKKGTPLFRYHLDEENENEENEIDHRMIWEIDPAFHDEENINIIQAGKDYVTAEDGIFIIENYKPRIAAICYHGTAEVKISEDSMKVLVDLYPSVDDHPIPSLDEIIEKIISLEVKAEIDKELLAEKLKIVEETKVKISHLCVAKGKDPIHGENGRLENRTNKKEKLKHLDHVEFRKVNPVISVKEGETIAILHPPTEGEAGINVFGNSVPPIPGKESSVKLGSHIEYSEENDKHIIAMEDGFLTFSDSSITITETFTVSGDIDFKSGNINSKGALIVTGNVNNEFEIKLTKNIEIHGYVGDAILESGNCVIVHGGFLGKGKGVIRSEGDVQVKFVENQQVFSRGSITIAKEALNAKVYAKHDIIGTGNAVIVGGETIAGDSIEVYCLGNNSEQETIVEVGFDYLKRNSINNNKEKLRELRKQLEDVDQCILEYAKMKRLNPQSQEKLRLLANTHKHVASQVDEIKATNMTLTNAIYVPTKSKVTVKGPIYPGVKIGINGRFMLVNEYMKNKTFVLSEDNEVILL